MEKTLKKTVRTVKRVYLDIIDKKWLVRFNYVPLEFGNLGVEN